MRPGGTPPASKTCPRQWWPRSSPAPGPHTHIRWRTWPDRQRGRPRAPGVGLARRRHRPPSPRPHGPASPHEPAPPAPRPDQRAITGGGLRLSGPRHGLSALHGNPRGEPRANRRFDGPPPLAGGHSSSGNLGPESSHTPRRAGSALLGQRVVVVGAYTVRASAAAGGDRRPALPLARPPCPAHWNTFAFGYGMSAFGRPGGDRWNTFASGYGMSAFGRPGGDRWNTFAFGCGMSAFGRPGGRAALMPCSCLEPGQRARRHRFDRRLRGENAQVFDAGLAGLGQQLRNAVLAIPSLAVTHAAAAAELDAVHVADMRVVGKKFADAPGRDLLAAADQRVVAGQSCQRVEPRLEQAQHQVAPAPRLAE